VKEVWYEKEMKIGKSESSMNDILRNRYQQVIKSSRLSQKAGLMMEKDNEQRR